MALSDVCTGLEVLWSLCYQYEQALITSPSLASIADDAPTLQRNVVLLTLFSFAFLFCGNKIKVQ